MFEAFRAKYLIGSFAYSSLFFSYVADKVTLHCGVVVITTAQLNSTGSAQIQILLAECRRFEMVNISDSGPDWK